MAMPSALRGIFDQKNASYKMVLILSLIDLINEDGKANYSRLEEYFVEFFKNRHRQGRLVEKVKPELYDRPFDEVDWSQLRKGLKTALGTIPMKAILEESNGQIGFKQEVFAQLDDEAVSELRAYANRELSQYFGEAGGETVVAGGQEVTSLREAFETVFANYLDAKKESMASHPIADLVRVKLPQYVASLPFIRAHYKVQGSAGRPAWARMPWMAIMDERLTRTPQQSFYPCYIFSESMDVVYLTLKHSVPKPVKQDELDRIQQKVEEIRADLPLNGFVKDDLLSFDQVSKNDPSYMSAVIAYKRYEKDNLPSEEVLMKDLQALLHNYDFRLMKHELDDGLVWDEELISSLQLIKQYIELSGFTYPKNLIENFYLSLFTKPFVILAGISGTGKTKLVKLFAEAMNATQENGRFTLIPVRPDWSDPTDLIGYYDLAGTFRAGVLTEVLEKASKPANKEYSYFVCLDEMNLARVEHYFSDLLSIMETRRFQKAEDEERIVTDPVISGLHIPDNVYFIGTVNMDETTHPFSKKVLDRANTIEFNYIDLNDLGCLDETDEQPLEPLRTKNYFLRSDYLHLVDAKEHRELIAETTEKLVEINRILENIHAHVGFRVRDELCFYMIYNDRLKLMDKDAAFDIQLCQKILPRIQGSNEAVRQTLISLMNVTRSAGQNSMKPEDLYDDNSLLSKLIWKSGKQDFDSMKYPTSARKVAFMLRRFEEDGFTSFWLS